MLAYIFWHVPFADTDVREYETALLGFHTGLVAAPPAGLEASATYQISEVPWLSGRLGYEDWCFMTSSAVLDTLNNAAVGPERWNVHAAIASKTDFGHGGLYYHLHGDEQPIAGSRVIWLKRPRGIRYEKALRDIVHESKAFLSCWRKQMVLGPGGTNLPSSEIPRSRSWYHRVGRLESWKEDSWVRLRSGMVF